LDHNYLIRGGTTVGGIGDFKGIETWLIDGWMKGVGAGYDSGTSPKVTGVLSQNVGAPGQRHGWKNAVKQGVLAGIGGALGSSPESRKHQER
jgi:hypothetical protein